MILCVLIAVPMVWANTTRMDIFMAGDYIDDVVNIDLYPNHIPAYSNMIYGDVRQGIDDYGVIFSPEHKLGALGVWQNREVNSGFNIGYALNLYKFDIGISGSPMKDNYRYAFGIGRSYFGRRFDAALLIRDALLEEWIKLNIRCTGRRGDFVIVPKYTLDIQSEPDETNRHRIGIMLQRLILNEGFVYLIAEYDFTRGDYEYDYTHVYAGLELPISRHFALLLGAKETFADDFETATWLVNPGLSIRVREFTLDFHINQDRLYDKDQTWVQSFGLDLDFSGL
jgi:hypothetical protein